MGSEFTGLGLKSLQFRVQGFRDFGHARDQGQHHYRDPKY